MKKKRTYNLNIGVGSGRGPRHYADVVLLGASHGYEDTTKCVVLTFIDSRNQMYSDKTTTSILVNTEGFIWECNVKNLSLENVYKTVDKLNDYIKDNQYVEINETIKESKKEQKDTSDDVILHFDECYQMVTLF